MLGHNTSAKKTSLAGSFQSLVRRYSSWYTSRIINDKGSDSVVQRICTSLKEVEMFGHNKPGSLPMMHNALTISDRV